MKAGLESMVTSNANLFLEYDIEELVIRSTDKSKIHIELSEIINDCIKDYKLYTIRLIVKVYEWINDFSSTVIDGKYLFILHRVGNEIVIHRIEELAI